jgi:hypothetical protein
MTHEAAVAEIARCSGAWSDAVFQAFRRVFCRGEETAPREEGVSRAA